MSFTVSHNFTTSMSIKKIYKYKREMQLNSRTYSQVGGYNTKYWPDVSKGPLNGHAWTEQVNLQVFKYY